MKTCVRLVFGCECCGASDGLEAPAYSLTLVHTPVCRREAIHFVTDVEKQTVVLTTPRMRAQMPVACHWLASRTHAHTRARRLGQSSRLNSSERSCSKGRAGRRMGASVYQRGCSDLQLWRLQEGEPHSVSGWGRQPHTQGAPQRLDVHAQLQLHPAHHA